MIEKIIILSISSIAICCTTWDGMIFDKPARFLETYLPEIIIKPFFGCYVCASLWWSIAIALLVDWPVYYCVPAMGVSAIISIIQND